MILPLRLCRLSPLTVFCVLVAGTLASLSLEESTRHILTTYRPSTKHPNIRHQVRICVSDTKKPCHWFLFVFLEKEPLEGPNLHLFLNGFCSRTHEICFCVKGTTWCEPDVRKTYVDVVVQVDKSQTGRSPA